MKRSLLRTAALFLLIIPVVFAGSAVQAATPKPTSAHQSTAPLAVARGSVTQRPYVVMIDNHPKAFPPDWSESGSYRL